MIKKSATTAPALPQENVIVPELGGEVLVKGLLLKDRLAIAVSDGYERMGEMLAACVYAKDDTGAIVQLWTADEWERFGSVHYTAALKLWDVTRRLSDLDGATAAKNSKARKLVSPTVSP